MQKTEIIKGDITQSSTDAIVNAANGTLLGGGGVDGAIHRAAGPKLLAECMTLGGCQIGDAKITRGYNLPAKYVIHTVGPVWSCGSNNEDKKLASCYSQCLRLAAEYKIKTIAFPSISTGAYRYPIEEACKIALHTVITFLRSDKDISKVIFVCFDDKVYNIYLNTFKEM